MQSNADRKACREWESNWNHLRVGLSDIWRFYAQFVILSVFVFSVCTLSAQQAESHTISAHMIACILLSAPANTESIDKNVE